jgi:hypothetical protein
MGKAKKQIMRIILLFLFSNLFVLGAEATIYTDPSVTVTSPKNYAIVVSKDVTVKGTTYHADKLKVNEHWTTISGHDFSTTVTLTKRTNVIPIIVSSSVYSYTYNLTLYYSFSPTLNITSHKSGVEVLEPDIIIQGTTNMTNDSDIDAFTVNGQAETVTNGSFTSSPITLKSGDNEIVIKLTTTEITTETGAKVLSKIVTRTIKIKYNDLTTIDISEPLEGSTQYNNIVNVNGTLSKPEDITSMKIGDKTVTVDGGSFSQDITLKPGKNEIKLTVGTGDTTVNKTLTVYYSTLAKNGSMIKALLEDGAELKGFDDMVKIKFPKSSVDLNTTAQLTVEDVSSAGSLPAQSALIGPVFKLTFEGERPIKPFKVTLKYDSIIGDNQSHKVSFFFYDEEAGAWQILGGIVDIKNKTVAMEVEKPGFYSAAMYYRTFNDASFHWAKKDIEFLTAQGAITDQGENFRPSAYISRADFVTFLVKALGIQPYNPETPSYTDVVQDMGCYKYVEAALRAGLVSGVTSTQFAPDRPISREEAGVIMARAGNLKPVKEQELTKVFETFPDAAKISSWAKNDLASAIKAKVICGSLGGKFLPKKYTTRAEAATLIARLREIVAKTKK